MWGARYEAKFKVEGGSSARGAGLWWLGAVVFDAGGRWHQQQSGNGVGAEGDRGMLLFGGPAHARGEGCGGRGQTKG